MENVMNGMGYPVNTGIPATPFGAVAVPADNVVIADQVGTVKPYTLRKLCARDVFPFAKILSKVGIKQFAECFELDENDNLSLSMSGLSVALNVIDILLSNLDKCENEIFSFLASVAGMTTEEVKDLDMDIFAEMTIEIFQKKEFSDFFKVVSRLLGLVN